jgi:hypothetical protein
MPSYSKVMIGFGLFLIIAGFAGWAATGFEPRGATAIASGAITGALMLLMAWLSAQPKGLAKNFGIHAGFVLALIFGLVFTWRGLVGWGILGDGEPKPWVATLISTMAVVSFVTFVMLLAMRPKAADRKPPELR